MGLAKYFQGNELKLSIFDFEICLYDFKDIEDYPEKEQTTALIDSLFELPEVINIGNVPDAQGGRALSTVHLCNSYVIPQLLDFKTSSLGRWILNNIFESALALGFHETRDIRKMKYHRTWVNRMTKGCSALAHRHAGVDWVIPHLVAIFYTDAPDNSADLIFINDNNYDVMRGDKYSDYDESSQHRIASKSGRLVCHDARSFHAVSIHENDLPRTCIIIEVGFAPLVRK